MKLFSFTMLWLFASFSFAKPRSFERQMAQYVYQDKDWLQYICGGEACSVAQMQSQLEFNTVTICTHPTVKATIVEPQNKASNFFTTLFIWVKGKPVPRIHFFGRGLGLDRDLVDSNGCRYVIGSEKLGADEYANYRYQWTGYGFLQVSVADYDTPLEVQPFIEKPKGAALLHPALGKCYADLQSFVHEQFGCIEYSVPLEGNRSEWVKPDGCENQPQYPKDSNVISLGVDDNNGPDSKWIYLSTLKPDYNDFCYGLYRSSEGNLCFLMYSPFGKRSEVMELDENKFILQRWFEIEPSQGKPGWMIEYRYDKKLQYFIPAKCMQLDGDEKGRRTKETEYPCESPVQ